MAFGFFKKSKKDSLKGESGKGPVYYSLKVKHIVKETREAISIVFEHPESGPLEYKPGQFLTLICTINGSEIRRAYSLCTSPYVDKDLAVTVKRVDQGVMSNWLPDHLKVGDEVKILEPIGNFTIDYDPQAQRHFAFYAGGSGITPMLSLVKSVLSEEPHSKITLVYANVDENNIIFNSALSELAATHQDRFDLIHILENVPSGWAGFSGRITAEIFDQIINHLPGKGKETRHFICGPEGMMKVVEELLEQHQVSKEYIIKESFIASTATSSKQAPGEEFQDREVVIRYDGDEYKIMVPAGKAILETALDAGIDLPFSCQSGLCTACRGKALSGQVKLDEEEGLSASEREEGYVLTCVGHPLTDDVVIEIG